MNKKVYVVMDLADFCDYAKIEGSISGEIFGIFESRKEAEKYMVSMEKKAELPFGKKGLQVHNPTGPFQQGEEKNIGLLMQNF
ncbi:MAG: hypothetical protein ACP5T9_03185 [Thermoplasmata archaeon]